MGCGSPTYFSEDIPLGGSSQRGGGGLPCSPFAAVMIRWAKTVVSSIALSRGSVMASLLVRMRPVMTAGCVAIILTGATLWTGWSLVSRGAAVLTHRHNLKRQVKDLNKYWEAAKKQPDETPDFEKLQETIRKISDAKERAGTEEAVARAAVVVLRKVISDAVEQQQIKLSAIEHLQSEYEAEFGERIRFQPGPPPTYNTGPEPVLYGPDNIRITVDYYFGVGRSHVRYAKWRAAREACNLFNAGSASLYPLMAQTEEEALLAEQTQREAAAILKDCSERWEDLTRKLKEFTESPPAVVPEVGRLKQQLANSLPVLVLFGISDLTAFAGCCAAATAAWSRVALIAKLYSSRQLYRV